MHSKILSEMHSKSFVDTNYCYLVINSHEHLNTVNSYEMFNFYSICYHIFYQMSLRMRVISMTILFAARYFSTLFRFDAEQTRRNNYYNANNYNYNMDLLSRKKWWIPILKYLGYINACYLAIYSFVSGIWSYITY